MPEESKSGSWWLTTIPGVLTGVAAVITAVTGLAVGLHQISGSSGTEKASPEKPSAVTTQNNSKPHSASSDPTTSQSPSSDDASQQSLALPAGMEVKMGAGPEGADVYKILSARLEPYHAEKRLLTLTIRYIHNGRGSVIPASFRLLVDDVPRAPLFGFDGSVEMGSAKEADVGFEVPITENNVVLQISAMDEKTEIPLDLTATET
jgi:hypothetical protein